MIWNKMFIKSYYFTIISLLYFLFLSLCFLLFFLIQLFFLLNHYHNIIIPTIFPIIFDYIRGSHLNLQELADASSRPMRWLVTDKCPWPRWLTSVPKKRIDLNLWFCFCITLFVYIIFQVNALLWALELHESAKHKDHFALCYYLVLGHTKCNSVSWET